jgi:hypothetical protein
MELNKTSTLVVKKWIEDKRIALVNEMTAIKARIDVYTQMLKELEQQQPVVVSVKRPNKRGRPATSKTDNAIALALEAAGSKGLTARELAEVAHLPIGTAGSRLTHWNKAGKVKHITPKYFIVHSTQEDNNVEQGGMQ